MAPLSRWLSWLSALGMLSLEIPVIGSDVSPSESPQMVYVIATNGQLHLGQVPLRGYP